MLFYENLDALAYICGMSEKESENGLQEIVSHCKEYGFIFPSSEIYGQLQAVYDYGPYGLLLKDKIQRFWREALRLSAAKVVGLETSIFMDPRTWEASGHLDQFKDLFVDNKDSQKRYRVDQLIESQIESLDQKAPSDAEILKKRYKEALGSEEVEDQLQSLLKNIVCPVSGTDNWTPLRRLHLMFSTEVGASVDDTLKLYLRPETAQGIYVNFLNVQKSLRLKIPFGIAQTGKAFRNELIARQFTFRMREFTQMEMQFFVEEKDSNKWFDHWQAHRMRWYEYLGIPAHQLRLQPHHQLAHYARRATDIEYRFPFGWKEVEGIHDRGNFDLSAQAARAGKRLDYFDTAQQKHYTPHVVETSAGLDRLCLMMLSEAYQRIETKGKERQWLSFAPPFAPVQVAVFPLLRKEALIAKAKELFHSLCMDFEVIYEEIASIGKRYARQDAIGTPFCVTIDHESLSDDQVTLRLRDSTEQIRMPMGEVGAYVSRHCSLGPLLSQLKEQSI